LLGDSLPGERAREAALLQSGELQVRSTRDAYREIKPIFQSLFEEQNHLNRPARVGGCGKRRSPGRKHARMREFLEPEPLAIVLENPFRQPRPIDRSVRIGNLLAVAFEQRRNYRRIGQHLIAHYLIRVEPTKTTRFEHARSSRFTTTQSARDSRDHNPVSSFTFGLATTFGKFLIAAVPFPTCVDNALNSSPNPASAPFPPVDTKNAAAVTAFVAEKFATMYPGASQAWLQRILHDIEGLFLGQHPDYAPVDCRYHDLEHTLQASVCMVLLMEGRHMAGVEPHIDARQFELAVAAVLLHDSGYLKMRSDTQGTGAKYTFCHVLRSCAFVASYLPTLGSNDYEIEAVLGAINCTGPTKEISRLYFRDPVERVIGCALATADYLGQMAAADYPDELDILFHEFQESDDFIQLPPARRMFKSTQDLMERTPMFWQKFVLRKLENDYQAMYRFLARPYPQGPNPYLDAVERNIAEIKRRTAALAPKVTAPDNAAAAPAVAK
jgi:hypothetical protein